MLLLLSSASTRTSLRAAPSTSGGGGGGPQQVCRRIRIVRPRRRHRRRPTRGQPHPAVGLVWEETSSWEEVFSQTDFIADSAAFKGKTAEIKVTLTLIKLSH